MKFMKKQSGLTFIELMVVVGFIAVLSMVAYPSYQKYVLRLNRIEAKNTMDMIAQRLEQNFSVTRDFTRYYDPKQPEYREGFANSEENMLACLGYTTNPASSCQKDDTARKGKITQASKSSAVDIPQNKTVYKITLTYITKNDTYGPGDRKSVV